MAENSIPAGALTGIYALPSELDGSTEPLRAYRVSDADEVHMAGHCWIQTPLDRVSKHQRFVEDHRDLIPAEELTPAQQEQILRELTTSTLLAETYSSLTTEEEELTETIAAAKARRAEVRRHRLAILGHTR